MQRMIFISILLLPALIIQAQQNNRDSLLQQLAAAKEDTNKVWLYLKLSKATQSTDMTRAHLFCEQAYSLSEKLNFNKGRFKSIIRKTALFRATGNVDSVFEVNKRFLSLARQMRDTLNIAIGYMNIAESYSDLGDPEKAIDFSLQGLAVIESSGAPELKQDAYDNLQRLYFTRLEYDKSIEYGTKSLQIARALNVPQRIASSLFNLSVVYNSNKEFDKAIAASKEAVAIGRTTGEDRVVAYGLSNLCDVYLKLNNIPAALNYELESFSLAKKVGDRDMEANALTGLGVCYLQQKEYARAQGYATQAVKLHEEMGNITGKVNATKVLADIAFATGDPTQGYAYELLCDEYEQKHNNQVLSKQSSDLEKKYETAKKEKEIIQLQKDKQIQDLSLKQKSTLNYFLIGSVAALLIVSFLGYRNLRHRQQLAKQQHELHQQQIRELEKDKQLVAVDSMLKGQEDERSRLAKDLHDGLGGLLSGVKFSLSNMKDNLIITPDNMTVFERSLDMIDTSIKELRRVAHNMMPEMLTKFGLDEALKEYCNSINTTKLLIVKYQSLGMEERLDKSIEIIIYRIVQELLNNTMKHAVATEAFVQLIREGARLNVVVEDNGKGFDSSLAENNKGAGLENVRSRVDYLKGQLDVHAEPGKGTLVNIEFNV
ncbi:MAG: sensor histidine kinase [Chitinophagaceae bacterium]|nr:sensor histidine kinase [Chitinophagaceae bacterium]